MNKALLHTEVQDFLEENYKEDISKIVFKGSPFSGVSQRELAIQLTGKMKAEKKLPTWFHARGIIYPPTLNLEQTSSEKTAEYKASLLKGKSIVDITGGFGIDSYFFSKRFDKVVHCELNEELSEIAAHNFKELDSKNIESYCGDGIEFLKNAPEVFDWIYIDPSRRNKGGGRVFHLSDCLPDVPNHLNLFWKKGKNILIKTSPLLDIQAGIRELKNIQEIHVVAVENEVKELLWILKKNTSGAIKIKTLNFRKKGDQVYENSLNDHQAIDLSKPISYLYEPNAALMKSGLYDALGNDLGLAKLHSNTHLFTSDTLVDFPGRRFKILEIIPYKKKKIKAVLKIDKAHVSSRNFPESVANIRKQFKLKDGGDHYLFFTTSLNDKKILLICEKLNDPF